MQSVILNQRTGRLIDGHLRVELAIKGGEREVPVVVVDLSEEEENQILATFDPISAMAKVNHEGLAKLIGSITSTNPEVKDLIERIRKQACIPSMLKGDAVLTPDGESEVKEGDVYRIGEHLLMCGSSASQEHMKRLVGEKQVSLMVTDPPYGVDYGSVEEMRHDCCEHHGVARPAILGDKTVEEAKVLWDYAFTNVYPYCKDGMPFYVFSPQGHNFYELSRSIEDSGFEIHQQIVWLKNRFIFGRSDYKYKHEMIIYGWKKGSHPFYGGGNDTSVWECDAPLKSELHPTQKPVSLYSKAILNSSEVGEYVIDPFGGSGTVIEACEKAARKALTMELSPVFCASILKRYEELGVDRVERRKE